MIFRNYQFIIFGMNLFYILRFWHTTGLTMEYLPIHICMTVMCVCVDDICHKTFFVWENESLLLIITYLFVSELCGALIFCVVVTVVDAILKSGSTDSELRLDQYGCFSDAFGSWSERKRWISAISVTKMSKKKVKRFDEGREVEYIYDARSEKILHVCAILSVCMSMWNWWCWYWNFMRKCAN